MPGFQSSGFSLVCIFDRDTQSRTHERRAAVDTVCNALIQKDNIPNYPLTPPAKTSNS
jgi:hypothetical protein